MTPLWEAFLNKNCHFRLQGNYQVLVKKGGNSEEGEIKEHNHDDSSLYEPDSCWSDENAF